MSVVQVRAAYRARAGSGTAKAVLVMLADVACERCGLAWPGVGYIAEATEISRASVTRAVRQLEDAGLLRVHGYARGGRSRATEYVVLPALPGLEAAPCAGCQRRQVRREPATPAGMSSVGDAVANLGIVAGRKP